VRISARDGGRGVINKSVSVLGVSTGRIHDLVLAMGLSGINKSQVSKLCKEVDGSCTPSSTGRSPAAGPKL